MRRTGWGEAFNLSVADMFDVDVRSPKAVKPSVFLILINCLRSVCRSAPGCCNHITTKWWLPVYLLSEVERLRAGAVTRVLAPELRLDLQGIHQ